MTAADVVAFAFSALFFAGCVLSLHQRDRWAPTVARLLLFLIVAGGVIVADELADPAYEVPRAPSAAEVRAGG